MCYTVTDTCFCFARAIMLHIYWLFSLDGAQWLFGKLSLWNNVWWDITFCSTKHTHTFNSPFSGTTRISRYQKGETNLDFTEATDSEWQWHQLGHMQICTSLQIDNHASTLPLRFLQAGCPSCRPTNSVTVTALITASYWSVNGHIALFCYRKMQIFSLLEKHCWFSTARTLNSVFYYSFVWLLRCFEKKLNHFAVTKSQWKTYWI